MRKLSEKVLSSLMAIVLAVGLMPLPAFAETADGGSQFTAATIPGIEDGGASGTSLGAADDPSPIPYVDASGNEHSVSDYTVLENGGGGLQAGDGEGSWYVLQQDVYIENVWLSGSSGGKANLVLCDGATLSTKGISMDNGMTLRIWGQSVVQPPAGVGADYDAYNDANITTGRLHTTKYGIRVQEGRSVEINGGIIRADTSEGGHAGIGGNNGHSAGNITINGGVIKAWGTDNGAGIGGGNGGNGGTITINGGQIWTKPDSEDGAGIGGGNDGDGGTITINGGTISANGSDYGAGIGGGDGGAGGTITINGGTVNAKGGKSGAGIGAGNERSDCGEITIAGGTVNANGGSYGAGIGGGYRDSARNNPSGSITISGGLVKASGGENATGIGGGLRGAVGSIAITGGQVNATGNYRGAGIGGGADRGCGSITIENAPLVYATSEFGAGIGTGGAEVAESDPDVVYGGGDISITNSNVVGISFSGGAGIGGGIFGHADTITISGGSIIAQGGATYEVGEIPLLVMLVAMGDYIRVGDNGKSGLMGDLHGMVRDLKNHPDHVIQQAQNAAIAGVASAVSKFFSLFGGSKDDVDVIFYTGAAIGGGYHAESGKIRIENGAVIQCAAGMLPSGLQKPGWLSAAVGPGAGSKKYDVQIYPEALVTTARIDIWQDVYEGYTVAYIPLTNDGALTPGAASGDLVATKNYAEIRSGSQSFAVAFNANGGKGNMDVQWFDRSKIAVESKALSSNAFSNNGKSFGGWIEVDPTTGQPVIDEATGRPKFYPDQFNVTNAAFPKALTVLAAYWVEPTSVIKYYGSDESAEPLFTQILHPGTQVRIAGPKGNAQGEDGWSRQVVGWKVKGGDGEIAYTPDQWIDVNQLIEEQGTPPIELVAVTNGNSVSNTDKPHALYIRYTANGGVGSDIFDFHYGSRGITLFNASTFTREGYSLSTWHLTSPDGYDKRFQPGRSFDKSLTGPDWPGDKRRVTADAIWSPNTYKVAFNANGGEGTMSDEGFTYDATKPLDQNRFTKENAEFMGWNTEPDGSGTAFTDGQVVKNLASKGKVTLYAQWRSNNAYVKFDANNPDEPESEQGYQSFVCGEEKALRSNSGANAFITRDHYACTGWNTEPDGSGTAYADGASIAPMDDLTLYAQWSLVEVKVTFDANVADDDANPVEGIMETQYVALGTTLSPNAFTREGYTFLGWNTSSDGSGKPYADNAELAGEMDGSLMLFAQWAANPKITYYDIDKTSVIVEQEVEYGSTVQLMSADSFNYSSSYTAYWNYLDGDYQDQRVMETELSDVTQDLNLYLHSTAPMDYYVTITYLHNGGKNQQAVEYAGKRDDIADIIGSYVDYKINPQIQFRRDGYHFVNWKNQTTYDGSYPNTYNFSDKPYEGKAPNEARNLTLLAQWEPNVYTVTFNSGFDSIIAPIYGISGSMADQSFTYDEWQTLSTNNFARIGYTFVGWNTRRHPSEDNPGTSYHDGESVKNITTGNAVTLYAQWAINTYTVSFETGRGSHVTSQTVNYNTKVTEPADPTLAGYTFDGWYADEERTQAFDFNTGISVDTTLYAKWSPNAYTVKFDANGGDDGTMADQAFTFDEKQALAGNAFARTGYTFVEWNTAADGSGRSYADAAEVADLTADSNGTVTLYAQWEPNAYLVGFNANAEDATGEMGSQPFTYDDEEQALLENSFEREGYRFAGWNTEPDGSGTAYADGEAVKNLTAEASGYVGLYAQWRKLPTWKRLAGDTRYDTMAAIAAEGFESSRYAVLATGDNFPDALSASALAGAYDCPVVLTEKGALSAQARSVLEGLGVKEVFIMGGTAAVSVAAENAVKGMGIGVTRVAGTTRQDTAVAALEQVVAKSGGSVPTVVIAAGSSYADALSAGPWSYAQAAPIVLAQPDGRLSAATLEAVRRSGAKSALIVGGTLAVSADVEAQLRGAGVESSTRLGGDDRYGTSALVAEYAAAHGLGYAHPAVASGANFPDALAGAALAGSRGSVLLLADGKAAPTVEQLAGRKLDVESGYFYGGTLVVTEELADYIVEATN